MNILTLLWEKWKVIAAKIGNFQARLLFSLIYFLLTWPFALIVKYKTRPFSVPKQDSNWHTHENKQTMNKLKQQY